MSLLTRVLMRDARSFVGRKRELAVADELLAAHQQCAVLLVHGEGGIGKSALVREVCRRAVATGWTTLTVDGRDIDASATVLDETLEPVMSSERLLLVLDAFERIDELSQHVRRTVLPALPMESLVVIVSRRPPSHEWFADGWDDLVVELPVGAMLDADAERLLGAPDVADDALTDVLDWAQGSPLALSVAANALRSDPDWRPDAGGCDDRVTASIITRLVADELEPGFRAVISVAAITRIVTTDLLRAALPGVNAEAAMAWLHGLTLATPESGGVRLHRLARRVLRNDIRDRDPEYDRELRRRIVDHLYERGRDGLLRMTAELADLSDSPYVHAYGVSGDDRFRLDVLRGGDEGRICQLLSAAGRDAAWISGTRRLLREAPERAIVVRGPGRDLCGFAYVVTPANAPAAAHDDPLLGAWLARPQVGESRRELVLWRDNADFTPGVYGRRRAGVQALLNAGGILRSGLTNPVQAYLPVIGEDDAAVAGLLHARHCPSFDLVIGHDDVECHVVDYGPGGLLAAQRNLIYSELGLTPPPFEEPLAAMDQAVALEALQNYANPVRLAACPIARGATPDERIDWVRGLIDAAIDRALDEPVEGRLLRQILVLAYLEPAPNYSVAASMVHVSRSTFFRRLSVATELVVAELRGRR